MEITASTQEMFNRIEQIAKKNLPDLYNKDLIVRCKNTMPNTFVYETMYSHQIKGKIISLPFHKNFKEGSSTTLKIKTDSEGFIFIEYEFHSEGNTIFVSIPIGKDLGNFPRIIFN